MRQVKTAGARVTIVRTAIPRYLEIERSLREQIADARPGDPLPSDADLCARFGVSRMTARQAVQALAAEGLLLRRPGHGTFVAEPPFHRRMGRLLSFSAEMRGRGLEPSSRVLAAGLGEASVAEATALALAPGDTVVRLHRVRLADGVPMAIERCALPGSCGGVLAADLAHGSLHDALAGLGRRPSLARGSLRALLAGAEDAALLELPARAPLLVEQRVVSDAAGRPLEQTETRYAGDRYVFDVELHHVGSE